MNKKKILFLLLAILVVVIIFIVVFFLTKNNTSDINENNRKSSIKVTGKLEEKIKDLNNSYTIKYSGTFLNDKKEKVNAIVEYTKSNDDFAIKSNELGIFIVYKQGVIKSISNKYKMIAVMPKSAIDISMYNLIDDFGQKFNKVYKENIDSKEYDVEEYIYNDMLIKYYYLNDDIKMIKYNDNLIKVIRMENKSDKELFNIPTDYKIIGE